MSRGFERHRTKATHSMGIRGSWRLMVVPVVLAMGLLLAACGSSSTSATPSTSPTATAHPAAGNGNGSGNAGGASVGLAKGVTVTVKGVAGDQLTVTTKVGGTKTVLVGSTTTITQNGTTTSLSAIKAGETVLVKGALNSSKDIVASSIAIQP